MSQASPTPAICEIDGCGVLAVGRCATCKRAFCATHQGYSSGLYAGPYINMCAPCTEAKNAAEAKQKADERAPYIYFESGAARTELLASGVQPVTLYKRESEWKVTKRDFLGRAQRGQVDKFVPAGRGWVLGDLAFTWEVRFYDNYDKETKKYLIALRDEAPSQYDNNLGITRIQPCPGGYEDIGGRMHGVHLQYGSWKYAMEAAKRLMGK